MTTTPHSLHELNQYLRRVLALNFPKTLWVRAEIGQLRLSRGHTYLDLVQKAEDGDELIARCQGVLWAGTRRRLSGRSDIPLDRILVGGNEVLFKARVDFHERYGLKLQMEEIDADYTLGKIRIRRLETLKRLEKEGLLGKNGALECPLVLQRIAVVSSNRAAGLQDYWMQIEQNPYGYAFRQTLFEALMQGEQSAGSIAKQLGRIAKGKNADAVVIIRGGGARMDLAAFDEYLLGKAIAECPIPVFTGIGHDVDETVADLTAHTALKTPTAVADAIIQHNAAFEGRMEHSAQAIKESAAHRIQQADWLLQQFRQRIIHQATQQWQSALRQLDRREQGLRLSVRHIFRQAELDLQTMGKTLHAHDWEAMLGKGYAIVHKKGIRQYSTELLNPGDDLNIILSDGTVRVKVTGIQSARPLPKK